MVYPMHVLLAFRGRIFIRLVTGFFYSINQSINQSINPVVLGDRIVAVDGAPVVSDEDFEAALAGARETGGGVVRFTLRSAEAAPLSLGAWPRKLIPPFLH